MTAKAATPKSVSSAAAKPQAPITVEDLRRKAYAIEDLAKSEVRDVLDSQGTKLIVAGVVTVAVVVSVAYFLGTRRGRRRALAVAVPPVD